jgi:hypothetical protein
MGTVYYFGSMNSFYVRRRKSNLMARCSIADARGILIG